MKRCVWMFVFCAAAAADACTGQIEEQSRSCPCGSGWLCCEGENVCVRFGTACPGDEGSGGAGDAPPSVGGTGAFSKGGSGGKGGTRDAGTSGDVSGGGGRTSGGGGSGGDNTGGVAGCVPELVVEIVDADGAVNEEVALAVDSSDGVHMAYFEGTTRLLRYAHKPPGGTWDLTNLADLSGVGSLAVDNLGGAHVCSFDSAQDELKYAYKPQDGSWTVSTIDAVMWVGGHHALAVDPSGDVHVSYADGDNRDLKYAHKSADGPWTVFVVDAEGMVGAYNSVAVDASGGVHISYEDSTNLMLKHALKLPGGEWTTEAVADLGDAASARTSLAVDTNGGVHISYDWLFDNREFHVKYAHKPPGGTWQNRWEGNGADSPTTSSVGVDSFGGVHLAFSQSFHSAGYGRVIYDYFPADGAGEYLFVESEEYSAHTALQVDRHNDVHIGYATGVLKHAHIRRCL